LNGRWWKVLGAYTGYSYTCDTELEIVVVPDQLNFYFKDTTISALNYFDQGVTNFTYPSWSIELDRGLQRIRATSTTRRTTTWR